MVKILGDISYTSWVIGNFLLKFTNFCYHGNKSSASKNSNDYVRLANPQNPGLVQKSGTYLKCELSYGESCVKICKFSLPW